MLKISSMTFSSHLDTSHHGLPNPFKDARIVADSMTIIHKATVFNGSCKHKGV